MEKIFVFFFGISLLLIGCSQPTSEQQAEATTDNHEVKDEGEVNELAQSVDGVHYGDKISEKNAMPAAELIYNLNKMDSVQTVVKGKVTNVCKVKGCWITVEDGKGNELFVKFKDYGFFMPFDIAGKTVAMEGYGFKEITGVDELRHYAEDEGKSKEEIEKITEPEEEFKFLAHGVKILN